MITTIEPSKGLILEIEYSYMKDNFGVEVNDINLQKGTVFDLIEYCDSQKGRVLSSITEMIENKLGL